MLYNLSLLIMLTKQMYGTASVTLLFLSQAITLCLIWRVKKEIIQLILIHSGPNKDNVFNTRFMQRTCLSYDVNEINYFSLVLWI